MHARPTAGLRHVPLGEGLSLVRVRVAPSDVVVLRGILAGYDGLASAHGDDAEIVALVTPDAMLPALEALLADLAREIPMERLVACEDSIDREGEAS